jgi:hypothetical protein
MKKMNSLSKAVIFAGLVGGILPSLSAHAETRDLREYARQYVNGESVDYNLPVRQYVERIQINAEGIRNAGFIKVFADGQQINLIGVPGYDPEYTFRVRADVSKITLQFETPNSIVIRDFKVILPDYPSGYSAYLAGMTDQMENRQAFQVWGGKALEIVHRFQDVIGQDAIMERDSSGKSVWEKHLLPLKKLAISEAVSDSVRDPHSMITSERALELAKEIRDSKEWLEGLLSDPNSRYDYLVVDLLSIKEDILKRENVSSKGIEKAIADLQSERNEN